MYKRQVYTLLGKVSEQSGFLFVYDSKVVDNDRMVKLGAGPVSYTHLQFMRNFPIIKIISAPNTLSPN